MLIMVSTKIQLTAISETYDKKRINFAKNLLL
jgi:hypothetical protein